MPSNLVINVHSVAGYNNKLQRATEDMKFGVNDVNGDVMSVMPHVDTKKTIVKPAAKPVIKPARLPTVPEENHTLLKAGLGVATVGLGFYIWR